MMKGPIAVMFLALLGFVGCTSHLIFVEEDHLGLKAQFAANNPAPAEVNLGYRRGIVAVIPQQCKNPVALTNPISITSEKDSVTPANPVSGTSGKDDNVKQKTVTVCTDPNELMSLYTVFRANVGFNDPIEVHHFLATGAAAEYLLSSQDDLRKMTQNLQGFKDTAGTGTTTAGTGTTKEGGQK